MLLNFVNFVPSWLVPSSFRPLRSLRLNVFFDCGRAALGLTYPALLDYLQMHYG